MGKMPGKPLLTNCSLDMVRFGCEGEEQKEVAKPSRGVFYFFFFSNALLFSELE